MAIDTGWERLHFGQVAERTGVSRPTLYKEFGSKQALARELVRLEGERFLNEVVAAMDVHRADVADAVEAGVRHTLVQGRENPLIDAVMASPGGVDSLLPFLVTRRSPVFDHAGTVLGGWFAEHHPQLDPVEIAETLDALIRLTVSHLVLPGASDAAIPGQLARLASRYLGLVPRQTR